MASKISNTITNKIEEIKPTNNPDFKNTWCTIDGKPTPISNVIIIVSLVTLILVVGGYIGYKITQTNNNIFEINESDNEEVNKNKKVERGLIASIFTSVGFGIVNGLVDGVGKVDPSTSTALFGLLLGGTFGFLFDNSLGTDIGLKTYQNDGLSNGFNYTMGNLATSKYGRYIVTMLIDMFVSLILFKPLYEFLSTKIFFACNYLDIY